MSGFTRELENKVLNHIFRNESYTPPEKVYVGLFTSTGEVTGAGYTRQEIPFRESSNGRIVNDMNAAFLSLRKTGARLPGLEYAMHKQAVHNSQTHPSTKRK